MATLKLKPGSKGKLVTRLQEYLNLKGKLPKPIQVSGEFGPETKEAVRFFQKNARLKAELDGTVGPETAGALARLVGPKAAPFAKAFGEAEGADTKAGADKKEADRKNANEPAQAKTGGKPGKFKNVLHAAGDYVISIPPDPAGKFPLLVLFAGDTKKGVMIDAALGLPGYFKEAILVFGERNGKFADFQSRLNELLAQTQTSIGPISLCGYSSGGQAAFNNYDHATKKVGLIDPNIKSRNFAKFDSKTILSINPRPGAWPFKDPDKKDYTVGQARIDAVDLVKKAGGYSEITGTAHDAYPAKFLKDFEGQLI